MGDYGDYSASAEDADTVAQTRIGRGLLKKKKKSCLFPKAPEDPRRLPTVTYCEAIPKNKPKGWKKWCKLAGCVVDVDAVDYGDYTASAEDADTVAQTRIGRGLLKKKKKSCLFPKAPEDPRRLP